MQEEQALQKSELRQRDSICCQTNGTGIVDLCHSPTLSNRNLKAGLSDFLHCTASPID
jgi:hypothetical protein